MTGKTRRASLEELALHKAERDVESVNKKLDECERHARWLKGQQRLALLKLDEARENVRA